MILARDYAISRPGCAVPCATSLLLLLLLLLPPPLLVHTISSRQRHEARSTKTRRATPSHAQPFQQGQQQQPDRFARAYCLTCRSLLILSTICLPLLDSWQLSLLAPSITASPRIIAPRRRASGIHAYSNGSMFELVDFVFHFHGVSLCSLYGGASLPSRIPLLFPLTA